MNQSSKKFLEELMRQPSPSGFEGPAQKVVRARMKEFAEKVFTDVHGNVFGVLNGKARRKVMLAGHVDEIGFMITHVDDKGFLYFSTIGGWDLIIAVGQRVCVLSEHGTVPGVIGRRPVHHMELDEKARQIKAEHLWIDIGASNKKDALKAVSVGDPVVIQPDFMELRNSLVSSRAFDDRVGAWVVTETLRLLKGRKMNVAVHAVSTVQEELGLRGATTSAYSINPDIGIAVDVGHTSDFPGSDPKKTGDISLGKGPIIHTGANINPVLGKMLRKAADKKKIKYQFKSSPRATGTDANAMQLSRGGCAAALVSVPTRYMHSPVEVISLKDLNDAAIVIAETIIAMSGRESFIPD